MMQISQLGFKFKKPAKEIFNDLTLSLEPGRIYGLLGKNGAGKTTLIHLMCGLLTPQAGSVELDGVNVRERRPSTLRDIFLVPEEMELPHLTLSEFVKVNAPFYPRFSHEQLHDYLQLFDMEGDMKLHALSMGQKKKVVMSFALATGTRVLLLDEPTNGLDIPGKSQFRKVMARGMSDDKLVLISTHQVRDIDAILDHVVILDRSRVLLNASTAAISERLAFGTAPSAQGALYAQPAIGGFMTVTPTMAGRETLLDMELLFNATLHDAAKINEVLNA